MAPKILVVDEDPDFVKINRLILATEGYEVITARSGDEALKRMRTDKPDLILLEIMMSSILDTVAISQALEQDPEWCKIPLIMMSSIASTEYVEAFPAGKYLHVDRWFSKPTPPKELLKAVARFVS